MVSIEYIQENKNYYEEKINELNDKVKYYQNKTQRQNKEAKRSNNIINELEKWLKQKIKENQKYDEKHRCEWLGYDFYTELLNKLRELKGSDRDDKN